MFAVHMMQLTRTVYHTCQGQSFVVMHN